MEIKNYFAQDAQGNIMPSANCYLYLPGTTTLATGLVDGNGTPISNPFLASSVGQVEFGAPNGVYDLRVALGARDWTIKVQCADIVQAMDVMDSILGSHAENPTTRNNGQPLQSGDETWNSTEKQPYWWDSSKWISLNDGVKKLEEMLADPASGGAMVSIPTGESLAQRTENVTRLSGITQEIDIVIGYGQSNMRGYAGNTPGTPEYVTPNVTLWNGTAEIPLTSYTPTQNDGVSTGSLFASFGNEFAAITGRRAIMANCGRGSQSIASLSKGASNTNYSGLVNWVGSIKAHITASGATVGKVSVLWCQGEADSVAGTPSASYYASLSTLWNDLKVDTGASVFGIFTVGFYADNSKLKGQAIQSAQRRFSADTPDAYIVFDDMETMGALDMKVDSVHLNQYGYNYMGKEGARSFCEAAYIDGSTQANRLAERFGVIALDGSQAWQFYGGWFNKAAVGTAWNLSTLGSRGITGVIGVEEIDTYTLRVTLASRIDYILKEEAYCFLATNSTRQPIRAVVLPNTYQNIDGAGNTFVDIRFFADVTYLIDLAAKTLTTQTADGISASLGNALISTATPIVWGDGGATITHLAGGIVPIITPNSDSSPPLPTFANAVGPSPLNVRLFDLAGAPANRKAWVQFKGAAIPITALGTPEVRVEVVGAKRRPS